VEIRKNFLDAIYQLGLTYLTLGNFQDAIKTFDNYLKFDQDSKRAYQVKGFIEFLKKKIENKN
jgi:Tfp pilus assembly protein PilF